MLRVVAYNKVYFKCYQLHLKTRTVRALLTLQKLNGSYAIVNTCVRQGCHRVMERARVRYLWDRVGTRLRRVVGARPAHAFKFDV